MQGINYCHLIVMLCQHLAAELLCVDQVVELSAVTITVWWL